MGGEGYVQRVEEELLAVGNCILCHEYTARIHANIYQDIETKIGKVSDTLKNIAKELSSLLQVLIITDRIKHAYGANVIESALVVWLSCYFGIYWMLHSHNK